MGAYFSFQYHHFSFTQVYNVELYVIVDLIYTDLTNIYVSF